MLRLAFVGDIALIGRYDIKNNPDIFDQLKGLSEELKQYDYVIGNLESPLTSRRRSTVCKSMHLRSNPYNVELLKFLHIKAVSLANNHIYDYGQKGVKETIDVLEANSIEWFGLNRKTITKRIGNESISISGFACYTTNGVGFGFSHRKLKVNPLTKSNVMDQLEKDRKLNAFSILSFHWGDEHTNFPKYEHRVLAGKIIEKKNVVIHGHHPHVIQGVQKEKSSIVAYSLGNFLFDDCISISGNFVVKQNENNKKTFIFSVDIVNNKVGKVETKGCLIDGSVNFFDINPELHTISLPLISLEGTNEYEKKRQEQIANTRNIKFGKKNVKWLVSRLNYYSIGAKLHSYSNRFRFKIFMMKEKK